MSDAPARRTVGRDERNRGAGKGDPSAHLVVRDLEQLRALADPFRLRILQGFGGEARTAKEVAQRIGEQAGKLYHHVTVLADAGLLELVDTRPVRGTIAKYYRPVALRFEVDGALLSAATDGAGADAAQLEAIASLLAETRGEVMEGYRRWQRRGSDAPDARPFVARLQMQASRESVDALLKRLRSLVAECGVDGDPARCCLEDAESWAITVVACPLGEAPAATSPSTSPPGRGGRRGGPAASRRPRR